MTAAVEQGTPAIVPPPSPPPSDPPAPKSRAVELHTFLLEGNLERLAEVRTQREQRAAANASMDRELAAAEARLKLHFSGDDRSLRDTILQNLRGPREELAKLDREIKRLEQSIAASSYVVENAHEFPDQDPETADHPIVAELKSALKSADDDLENATETAEAAADELKAAEIALAEDTSQPQVKINSTTGERTVVMRTSQNRWRDAQEALVRAKHRREKAKEAVAAARAELADKKSIEREIAKHDAREERAAAEAAEREALRVRVVAAGAELGRLVVEARRIGMDSFPFRKAITEGIESAGINVWDAREFAKPA